MRSSVLYLFEAWLLCTAFGLAVLAPLRRAMRDLWLPASPVLGAAFLVVVLHTTSVVVGTRVGIYLAVLPAIGLVILGVMRGRKPWTVGRPALLASALTTAVGLGGAGIALLPNLLSGSSRMLESTGSHDAFYYVSESVWLSDHSILEVPPIGPHPGTGSVSPLATSAAQAIVLPLRVGQALVSSSVNVVFHTDAVNAFLPTMAAWVLFMAGAVFVAFRLLNLGPVGGLACAVLTCGSALVLRADYDQHADSLLGMALVTLTLAAVLVASFRGHQRWLPALLLAALFGAYTEYTVFLLPALGGALLLTVGRRYLRRLWRGVSITLLAVAISPMIWYRGAKNLLVSQVSPGDAFPSPFTTSNPVIGLGRALGTSFATSPVVPVKPTLALALLLSVGVILAVALSRYRLAFLGAVGSGLAFVTYATAANRGYLQDRLVTLTIPLVIFTAATGWTLAVKRLHRTGRPELVRASRVLGAMLAVALVGSAAINVHSGFRSFRPELAMDRRVTAEYDQVGSWVEEFGGVEGEKITVAVSDLFPQLWTLYELREDDMVSYLTLRPDYLQPERYWDGTVSRYLIVGRGAAVAGAEGAVIRKTENFRLVDMSRGPVAVVLPSKLSTWSYPMGPEGYLLTSAPAQLIVLKGENTPSRLLLTLSSSAPQTTVTLTAVAGGARTAVIGTSPTTILVPVTDARTADLTLSAEPGSDQRIALLGAQFPKP